MCEAPHRLQFKLHLSVADPGFSRAGGAYSTGRAPTYDFVNFHRKLHEN